MILAKEKSNGRAYVSCAGDDAVPAQKVSCLAADCGGDLWCFVENRCGGWFGPACSKLQGFDLGCPRAPPTATWALVGLNGYSVDPGLGDLFTESDIYAEVAVRPSGRTYRSKVLWNSDRGDLGMHLYVPPAAASLDIALHDRDSWTSDDLVARCSVQLQVGPFEETLRPESGGKEVGKLRGYVALG